MNFFDEVGMMAIGSRIRLLGDRFGEDAAAIYRAYGTDLQPKWFPVFYLVSKGEGTTAGAIATAIGHSHASVSKILGEMAKAELVRERTDPADRRRTIVSLSSRGRGVARRIELQYADVTAAMEELAKEAHHDLWAALEDWEGLLAKRTLKERVLAAKREREAGEVRIEPYAPKYRAAFRALNEEWIRRHFKLERPDVEALSNPRKSILDRGGHIFVATLAGEPVGVCALVPREKKVWELVKMAVAPEARGRNIGWTLGRAVIEKARALGGEKVFLESNTCLKPAIGLYRKLGFEKISGVPSPYERCNIQMELRL